MIREDYVTKMISSAVGMIEKMVFHVELSGKDEMDFLNGNFQEKYNLYCDLVDKGQINEAENQLLENIDYSNKDDFQLALIFYSYLNRKDNDFLEDNDFSRQEIAEGIKNLAKDFGYGTFVEAII